MQIGILQTGHAPAEIAREKGDYPQMFARLLADGGFTFRTWDVEAGELPADVHEAGGWLITGSRHGVYEDHPWIAPLEDFIRQAVAAGVPVVGICFGHQIVARALGGRVGKHSGGWAVGPQDYTIRDPESDALLTLRLNAWHQDQVTEPPPGTEVIGRSDFCPIAALKLDDRVLTFQPHPEFDADTIRALAAHRGRGVVPDDRLDAALDALDGPGDADRAADIIIRFFRRHAEGRPVR